MGKPVAFFMVVIRRTLFSRWLGWTLPKKVSVKMWNRTRTHSEPFDAKVGSVYTLQMRDVVLDMGKLNHHYRLVKFETMSQVKAYCKAQGTDPRKLASL